MGGGKNFTGRPAPCPHGTNPACWQSLWFGVSLALRLVRSASCVAINSVTVVVTNFRRSLAFHRGIIERVAIG